MSAYVDGQLQPEAAAAVSAHMAGCRSCASLHAQHLQTRRLLNLSEADAWTPPDLRLRIAHAVAREPVKTRRALWPAGLLASAAIVALVAAFTLGAGPAGWTATPAAIPQSSPPSVVATAAPMSAGCARLSSRALARCLGVSLQFLPTVLDDARYGRTTVGSQAYHAILSPLSTERQSASLVIQHASVKGGGTGRISAQGRHGLVPE
jgi:anti-sigma factor RsiW